MIPKKKKEKTKTKVQNTFCPNFYFASPYFCHAQDTFNYYLMIHALFASLVVTYFQLPFFFFLIWKGASQWIVRLLERDHLLEKLCYHFLKVFLQLLNMKNTNVKFMNGDVGSPAASPFSMTFRRSNSISLTDWQPRQLRLPVNFDNFFFLGFRWFLLCTD